MMRTKKRTLKEVRESNRQMGKEALGSYYHRKSIHSNKIRNSERVVARKLSKVRKKLNKR